MTRPAYIWLGTILAPLPMALLVLGSVVLALGARETLWMFLLIAYLAVLVPLTVSYGIVRWLGWRSLWSHMAVMFVVALIGAAALLFIVDIGPDSSIAIEYDDGSTQPIPLLAAQALIAGLLAAINSACMAVFWLVSVRACRHLEDDS